MYRPMKLNKIGIPTSEEMLSMEDEFKTELIISSDGREPVKHSITIPKPSRWDKIWAKKLDKCSINGATEELYYAIYDKKKWRVLYAISKNIENNLNGQGNSIDLSSPEGFVGLAVYEGMTDVVAALAAAGADPERIYDNQGKPIFIAVERNNLKAVEILHAAGADVYPNYLENSASSEMKNLLKEKLELQPASKNAEIPKQNTNNQNQNSNAETEVKNDSDTQWKKIDNFTISKTVQNDEIRIKTIFNFKAQRVTILHDIIDNFNQEATHSYVPVTEKIRSIEQNVEVKEAYDKLTSMNEDNQLARLVLHKNKALRRIIHQK